MADLDHTVTIDNAIDFLQTAIETDVGIIKFRKKNGEMRVMRFTLNFEMIPPENRPKSFTLSKVLKQIRDNQILHVYDLDVQAWRSVPFDRTEWLMNGKTGTLFRVKKPGLIKP